MTHATPAAQHLALFGAPLAYRCPCEAACRAQLLDIAAALPDRCATGQRGPAVARPCPSAQGRAWPTNES